MNQEPQRPTNQAPMGQGKPSQPAVAQWLWITLIVVAVFSGFFVAWYLLLGPGKTTVATTTSTPATTIKTNITPTTSGSTATATPATLTDLTYNNSKYGFALTFPATWKDYKMKEANIEGVTATYYVNVPSADKSATGDSTANAGYFAPFAISVYTLDQWMAAEAVEGSKDNLITKNSTYAFAWNQSNGTMPSDWNKSADIKTIIASFKLK